jgi:capsid protein
MQLVDQYGRPLRSQPPRVRLRATYDAAQTTKDNVRHWRNADALSSAAANSIGVRKTLRERSRYEYANNAFCRGILQTLGHDLVGTGPRVQLDTGDQQFDRLVERLLAGWLKANKAAKKLRIGRVARGVDGEAFYLNTTNTRSRDPVKAWIRPVECDLFDDPSGFDRPNIVGGIEFDENELPLTYKMLKRHPGDLFAPWSMEAVDVDAANVCHWLKADRPGQVRGIPETTSQLNLYSQMRRWTLAVLQAAENAADFAAVLETSANAFDEDGDPIVDDIDAFESVEVDKGMMVSMPRGWKMSQFKPEQPVATYKEFRDALLNEAGRADHMPMNKARGDSSGYNYASGRLDHQTYYEAVDVDRQETNDDVLDTWFAWWAAEARLVYPELASLEPDNLPAHTFYYDGHKHADEVKHANATAVMVNAELITQDEYLMTQGRDPDRHWEAIKRQRERAAELAKIGPPPKVATTKDETEDTPADPPAQPTRRGAA